MYMILHGIPPKIDMNIRYKLDDEDIKSPYTGRDFVQFGKTKSVLNKRAQGLPSYSTHLRFFP